MVNILREAESKHKKVIQELEEEKCKHEHDTAQGDDITYGLEMERTRLRQELEVERSARKKLEKEVRRHQELADEERGRQKQIVLLLLAERKKIILKYIEERKRSEDLAQVIWFYNEYYVEQTQFTICQLNIRNVVNIVIFLDT